MANPEPRPAVLDLESSVSPKSLEETTPDAATMDLLHEYCKNYLVERQGWCEEEAAAIMLDAKLGSRLERTMEKWLRMDFEDGELPDEFLSTRMYDSPRMDRVNRILDQLDVDSLRREAIAERTPSTFTGRIPTTEAMTFGWQTVKRNRGFVALVVAVLLAVGVCGVLAARAARNAQGLSYTLQMLMVVINSLLMVGVTKNALRFVDGGNGSLADFVRCHRHFASYLEGTLLYHGVPVLGMFGLGFLQSEGWRAATYGREPAGPSWGLVMFFETGAMVVVVVLAIVWAIKFGFFPFSILDRRVGYIQAFKDSSRITKGAKWQLLLFAVELLGMNLLGLLCLLVGLFVTVPMTYLAAAYVYRHLQTKLDGAEPTSVAQS